jgi:hypothetical protein
MAFSGSDPILGKRRFFHAAAIDAAAYQLSIAFFSWLNQQGGKPDLQVVEFGHLTGTETVALAGAGTLLAVLVRKTTATAAYFKASDHNTTYAASTEVVKIKQSALHTDLLFFPKGLALATGFVLVSHTTTDGTTTSAGSDGAVGVVLLAA